VADAGDFKRESCKPEVGVVTQSAVSQLEASTVKVISVVFRAEIKAFLIDKE